MLIPQTKKMGASRERQIDRMSNAGQTFAYARTTQHMVAYQIHLYFAY